MLILKLTLVLTQRILQEIIVLRHIKQPTVDRVPSMHRLWLLRNPSERYCASSTEVL